MKKQLGFLIVIVNVLLSATAFASGEPQDLVPVDYGQGCGFLSEDGSRLMSRGQGCTADLLIYWRPTRRNKPIRYWIEFRPVGKVSYRRFATTRTFVDKNRDGVETFRFPFRGTGEYHVVLDTNNNGYPDYTTSSIWLYENSR